MSNTASSSSSPSVSADATQACVVWQDEQNEGEDDGWADLKKEEARGNYDLPRSAPARRPAEQAHARAIHLRPDRGEVGQ